MQPIHSCLVTAMEQHADITFEALPQRIDANKFKRRRRAEAAIPSSADQPSAAAAAAADEGNGDASAEAAAVAGAGGGAGGAAAGFSSGFGLGDIGQQHQEQEASQQQQHIEDAQQYRSAAVGEHKFEYLDHTADVQLHAWGSSLQEAFEQVGLAMFNYMTPIDALTINEACTREVVASGHDLQSLLFNYLDELLFIYATEYIMFCRIAISKLDLTDFSITATGRGEKFDRQRHECGTEVKAITYSAMQIREAQGDAEVFVIVDI